MNELVTVEKEKNNLHDEESRTNRPVWLVYLLALVGLIYLLNPTAGFLEIIPDNIPLVGNLDEGVAAVLVWKGISQLRQFRKQKRSTQSKNH